MEKIKFRVTGNQIEVLERPAVITAGTVGLEAEFTFDSQWDRLSKILVFKAGEKVIATALAGNAHSVPWEVLEKPNQWLCVGVYGANGEGSVVIPTLWAKVAVIHTGTEPEGDPALEPSAPIWQEAVALAELGASAEQELRAGVDSLAEELNLEDKPRNLGDMFSELLALDRSNGYMLNEHTENRENPHNVTCEQIGAATLEDILNVNAHMQDVAVVAQDNAVDIAIHLNTDDNPNPHEITCEKIGAVTKEQHDKDIKDAKDWARYLSDETWNEIENVRAGIYDDMYVKYEVNAMVAESKAVIVTVSGSAPSHTSQEIYALIQAGKVVYLELWGNTYTICSACTASEAKFENSYITSVTGADGKQYQAQQFRVYLIKNNVFNNGQAVTVPGVAYVDAQLAYYLDEEV